MKTLLYILILIFMSVSNVLGRTSKFLQFDRIQTNINASVFECIMQDSVGMIWVGTDNGLFSYDGYSFFPHKTKKENDEPRIHCGLIHSDSIFLGTDNGLVSYNMRTGNFYYHNQIDLKDIRCFSLSDSELWVGTLDGLFIYDVKTKETRCFATDKLPHKTVYSIIKAEDGNMYVGTYNGLCKINKRQEVTMINIPSSNKWKNTFVNVLLEDNENHSLWIGTEGNLCLYDINTEEIKVISHFKGNSIKSLNYDSEKNLLIGTDNGFYTYKHKIGTQRHYIHDSRNQQSIPNNIIWCIFTDKDMNIWLGTENGISLTNNNNKYSFMPVWEMSNTGNGNLFHVITSDSKGRYWYGGTDGLLLSENFCDEGTSRWFKVGKSGSGLSHNRIRHLFEDSTCNLWIATDGSIERYDEGTNNFVRYTIIDSTNTNNSNWAYYISEDSNNSLWISSCLGGIFVVNKEKLKECKSGVCVADKNFTMADGLKSMFVKQSVVDRDDNVWVLMYNIQDVQKINKEKIQDYHVCTIKGEYPEFLICDRNGIIWIGTNMGIVKINPATNEILRTEAGWYGNDVLYMAEVEDNIWITTTKGLYYIDKETCRVNRININDRIFSGLYYDKFDGHVYLGGYDGVGYCSPEIINMCSLDKDIHLTALSVNNDYISTGVITDKEFVLEHDENNLSFEFSDFQYSKSDRGSFMYMMSGIDTKWHHVNDHSNMIVYNNMPYGDFKLYVRHYGSDDKGYDIAHIRILPPWYLTVKAKTTYFLLVLGLVFWTINFFRVKNRLRMERAEKKRVQEQAMQKIRFMANLSHDLKSPVGMIVTPVSRLLHDTKDSKQKELLDIVYKNAINLNAKIHKLIEMNRMEDNESTLIISRIELVSFVREIYEKHKDNELVITHNWNFYSNTEKLFADMDIIKLESIINNLLSNAIKYTPNGGNVSINIKYNHEREEVCIEILDNGIGIPENEQPYVFQRFFQSSSTKKIYEGTGVGLYLVKTYTELHKGSVAVSSEGGKTIFSIKFPIDKKLNRIETKKYDETNVVASNTLLKILIVDDNKDVYDLLTHILSDKYKCLYAPNGKEAIAMVELIKPDLIITDYMMPVMDGMEMCKVLKSNMPTSTIPIVMLSAKDDYETIRNSVKHQIDIFIQKPFDTEILIGKIDLLIHKKEAFEAQVRIEKIGLPKETDNNMSSDEKFLINITRLIEDHISDSDFNVNALAELSAISGKQIYRKVKQLTGMSPVEYIKNMVLP